jgi:hypothetical protein
MSIYLIFPQLIFIELWLYTRTKLFLKKIVNMNPKHCIITIGSILISNNYPTLVFTSHVEFTINTSQLHHHMVCCKIILNCLFAHKNHHGTNNNFCQTLWSMFVSICTYSTYWTISFNKNETNWIKPINHSSCKFYSRVLWLAFNCELYLIFPYKWLYRP